MKKILLILITIILTTETYADCATYADYATTISTDATDIMNIYTSTTTLGTQAGLTLDTRSTVNLGSSAITYESGCYNEQLTGSYFDLFNKNTNSFWTKADDVYVAKDFNEQAKKATYAWAEADGGSFAIVLTDTKEIIASRRFTPSAPVYISDVAICADGRIYATGTTNSQVYVGIFTQNGASLDAISYSYKFKDLDYGYQVACDDNSDSGVVLFRTSWIEGSGEYAFMTLEADGDLIDADTFTDPTDGAGNNAILTLYQQPSSNTIVDFAGTNGALAPGLIYGSFEINGAGQIQAVDTLQTLTFTTVESVNSVQAIDTLSTGKFVITFTVIDESSGKAAIIKIDDVSGSPETIKVIDYPGLQPGDLTITNTNAAYFNIAEDYRFARLDTANNFDIWHVTAANTVYLKAIEYFGINAENYLALGYGTLDNKPAVLMADLSDMSVKGSQKITTYTHLSKDLIFVNGNDGFIIQLASNHGGGFQDFGNEEEPGPTTIPEFSTSTFLLAILLAGGLLYIIRKNR